MKPTVLLFEFNDNARVLKIRKALMPLGIRVQRILLKDYYQPIGYLAGNKEIHPVDHMYEGEGLSGELFVMAGIGRSGLDAILLAMRKQGVGTIPYKAMLTPTNQFWNALDLFKEIKKEHEQMHGVTS